MAIGLTDRMYYQSIADAIRNKNGTSTTYTPSQMAVAIDNIKIGTIMQPLENPATPEKIFYGYKAYNSDGEIIIGSGLPELDNPAAASQIEMGYKAYNSEGEMIVGTGTFDGTDTLGDFLNEKITEYSNDEVSNIQAYCFYKNSYMTKLSFPNCSIIKSYAFAKCSSLTEVSFINCKTVETSAFYNCSNLNQINFPKCETLSQGAFRSCTSLQEVTFSECLDIPAETFQDCQSLTWIDLSKCKTIGSSAFQNCFSLSQISFPNFSGQIYSATFENCSSITSAIFPNCTKISDRAFSNCTNLVSAYFPTCTYINLGGFTNCISLSDVTLPVCTQLDTGVFQSCSALPSIQLPSCKTIYSYAFESCHALSEIYAPLLGYVYSRTFNSCRNLLKVSFPSCSRVYSSGFRYCTKIESIYMPKCSYIYAEAFYNCEKLSSIVLSSGCTSIGSSAFKWCSALTSLSFPNCTIIYENALANCYKLSQLEIPKCTTIYSYGLAYCSELSSINLSKVTYIGSYGLAGQRNITSFDLPNCTTLYDYAFAGCTNLKSVNIPKISQYRSGLFRGCSSLEYYSMPSSYTIYQSVFDGCISLSKVDNFSPNGMPSYTFRSCVNLSEINEYLVDASYIGVSAFENCEKVTSVYASLCSYIYSYAFWRCYALSRGSFPKCNRISSSTFYNCSALSTLILASTSICTLESSNAFSYTPIYSKKGYIYVPASLVSKYQASSNWSYYSTQFIPLDSVLTFSPIEKQVYHLRTTQQLTIPIILSDEEDIPEFTLDYDDSLFSCSISEVDKHKIVLEITAYDIEVEGEILISTFYKEQQYSTSFTVQTMDMVKLNFEPFIIIQPETTYACNVGFEYIEDIPEVEIIVQDESLFEIKNTIITTDGISFDLVSLQNYGATELLIRVQYYGRTYEYISNLEVAQYQIENINSRKFIPNENGFYENVLDGGYAAFALCKVNMKVEKQSLITVHCINYSSGSNSYGTLSNLDVMLADSNSDASTNLKKSFQGENSLEIKTVTYVVPAGEHFICIKNRTNFLWGTGSLQFKITIEDFEGEIDIENSQVFTLLQGKIDQEAPPSYHNDSNSGVSHISTDIKLEPGATYRLIGQEEISYNIWQILSTGFTEIKNQVAITASNKIESGWVGTGYEFIADENASICWLTASYNNGSEDAITVENAKPAYIVKIADPPTVE